MGKVDCLFWRREKGVGYTSVSGGFKGGNGGAAPLIGLRNCSTRGFYPCHLYIL